MHASPLHLPNTDLVGRHSANAGADGDLSTAIL